MLASCRSGALSTVYQLFPMADFSSDGFSAVAAFFGKADDDDAKSRKGSKANATKSTLQTSGGRKKDRLGLGAKSSATSNSSGTFVGNEASRTIMKVGKASEVGTKILKTMRSKIIVMITKRKMMRRDGRRQYSQSLVGYLMSLLLRLPNH